MNLVMILCDQLNASVLEGYGGPVPTPNIRRIAQKGLTFDAAYCQTPLCTPSRASLITGLYPHRHGMVSNVFRVDYPLVGGPDSEEGITGADASTEMLLWRRGYQTYHSGKWHLSGEDLPCYPRMYREHQEYGAEMKPYFDAVERSGEPFMDWYGWKIPVDPDPDFVKATDRISDRWKSVPRLSDFYAKIGPCEMAPEDLYDYRVATRCVEAIAGAQAPFMLTCSFNLPHDPNVIPRRYYDAVDPAWIRVEADAPCEARYRSELSGEIPRQAGETFLREFLRVYYASVLFVDEQVGRVLDALQARGLMEDTAIVFTADHGDMAGGHGMFWKSTSAFYEEVARVPLIIAAPGYLAGERCGTPVELVDLPPTLLELAGAPAPGGLDGRSLVPALRGEALVKDIAFSERLEWEEGHKRRARTELKEGSFMLRQGDDKYVLHLDPKGQERMLFNLREDPKERVNRIAVAPQRAEEMHALLVARLKETDAELM